MPRVDKHIKCGMVIKDSLESKVFAIQTIPGNSIERKTYM